MREKVRPKMGKIDIDYQKLHDAFFIVYLYRNKLILIFDYCIGRTEELEGLNEREGAT